jgi:hypothetical protein
VRACIDAAGAFGLIEALGSAEKARLDGIVAVLTKLAR